MPNCRSALLTCLSSWGNLSTVTLRWFWFEFDGGGGLPFGCGVTAEDADSALDLIAATYCGGHRPDVRSRVDDVDVGLLADRLEKIVRPLRLGVPTLRGIWYPNLTSP